MHNIQTAVSPHPLEIGHVFMNLFTRTSPYYHLLKYLLFLLKHPVCIYVYICVCVCVCVYTHTLFPTKHFVLAGTKTGQF
jgi:hypothetical protein